MVVGLMLMGLRLRERLALRVRLSGGDKTVGRGMAKPLILSCEVMIRCIWEQGDSCGLIAFDDGIMP